VKTPQQSFQTADVVGKSWVSVKKVHSVSTSFPGKSITAVPVTESIDQGCNVELTQLETNAWWSLAFEAFGEDDCLMEHLQAVASCLV